MNIIHGVKMYTKLNKLLTSFNGSEIATKFAENDIKREN